MIQTNWIDNVCHVILDRPQRRNALDFATLQELEAAQSEAAERAARVLVISGREPAFCAGADLTGVEDDHFVRQLFTVLTGFGRLPCPTIAAIDGPALGAGTQLAVACDLRMATADSPLGIPAAKLGIAVDRWTVQRMTAELGWSIARGMLIGAMTYTASNLATTGFIHRLGTVDEALEWAAELAKLAPLSLRAHKVALEGSPPLVGDAPEIEAARLAAWRSDDAAEGVAAFGEKRRPNFQGH